MKRFRRGEALVLAAALALGLAGCGSTEKGKSNEEIGRASCRERV